LTLSLLINGVKADVLTLLKKTKQRRKGRNWPAFNSDSVLLRICINTQKTEIKIKSAFANYKSSSSTSKTKIRFKALKNRKIYFLAYRINLKCILKWCIFPCTYQMSSIPSHLSVFNSIIFLSLVSLTCK
jgi:hypothetical protein